MSPKSNSGFAAQATPAPVPIAPKGQFDTFETKFFEQGDQGTNQAAEQERFDDLDELPRARKGSSRQFVLGVAIGSASVAVLGCLGLWLSGARLATRAPIPATVVAAPPSPEPVAAPAPAPAPAPTPSPAVAQAEPDPAPVPTPAAAKVEPDPVPTPTVAPPAVAALPAAPQPEDMPEAKPLPVAAEAHEAVVPAAPTAAAPAVEAAEARGRCMKTVSEKRGKQILSVCGLAFAADPSAVDIAVLLAKTEFDKGRSAQALAWGKKAVAVDPNAADAYVFIGGAEQNVGHGKAAKEAYKRYLELAPTGRYAGDLRAIVGTLK